MVVTRSARPAVAVGATTTNNPPNGFFERHSNVYMYVPNLIGYVRVAISAASFAVAFRDSKLCLGLYFLSFVCDELDGRFARKFNQCSVGVVVEGGG